jgi:hypothetical protein
MGLTRGVLEVAKNYSTGWLLVRQIDLFCCSKIFFMVRQLRATFLSRRDLGIDLSAHLVVINPGSSKTTMASTLMDATVPGECAHARLTARFF